MLAHTISGHYHTHCISTERIIWGVTCKLQSLSTTSYNLSYALQASIKGKLLSVGGPLSLPNMVTLFSNSPSDDAKYMFSNK